MYVYKIILYYYIHGTSRQIDDIIHGFEFLTIPGMHIQTVLTHSPMAHSLEKASGAQQRQVGREA